MRPLSTTSAPSTRPAETRLARAATPKTEAVRRGCGWLVAVLVEAWRYLSCSRHSRLRQAEALRELDEHLRCDIGLPRRTAVPSASPLVRDPPW
jgi:hypothetical protein